MKIEGSVQEIELFFKKFEVKDKPTELKINEKNLGEELVKEIRYKPVLQGN